MEGDNLKWMEYFRQLIAEKHLHHTFWCYNANSGDTGGLVKDDFKTWDEEKYNFVKEVLWQTEDGKFIGLDHEVPLGANGIALSDYTGVKVTPAPVTPAAEDEPKTTETFDVTTSEATETGSGQIDSSNSGVVSELVGKATKELIIVAVIAVVLIIIIAAARIAVSHWSKKRKEQEEIILQDNNDLTVDEKESNEINSLGKNTDDNSEDN